MKLPERFSGLLVMNTALGTGDAPLTQGFLDWRAWNNKNPDMQIAKLMQRSCPHLSDAEAAAYAAPYPDADYKSGMRRFRSEEHTSELQSLMRISYAVFCLQKKTKNQNQQNKH